MIRRLGKFWGAPQLFEGSEVHCDVATWCAAILLELALTEIFVECYEWDLSQEVWHVPFIYAKGIRQLTQLVKITYKKNENC